MKIKYVVLALSFFLMFQSAKAQLKAADLVKEWERAKAYTKEYLDIMPESSYKLQPAPEMRSFAEQMLHLADANYGLGSSAMGINSPYKVGDLEKTSDKSRQNVSQLVLASYDYLITNLQKMTNEQLNETVAMIGKFDMPRWTAVARVFEHQTHHRGQTTVYLRLASVKPPQEKLF